MLCLMLIISTNAELHLGQDRMALVDNVTTRCYGPNYIYSVLIYKVEFAHNYIMVYLTL